MSEKCIIYISSTNYKLVSAGTEKFMGEVIESFKRKGIHSLQFFPLVNLNNKLKKLRIERNYIGVNYDGSFIGTYLVDNILLAIEYMAEKYNLTYDRIIINQLHSWNLKKLTGIFNSLGISIILIVHDYMMVCPHMMKPDSDSIRCGEFLDRPNLNRCNYCKYEEEKGYYFEKINCFFSDNFERICRVIFPSDSAKNTWLKFYPYLTKKSVVRPHLTYKIMNEEKMWNNKLRIGYLGYISSNKGYSEWLQLINALDKNKYDFYYFGESLERAENDGVRGILVDFNSSEKNSMVKQLKRNKIDIAFLWSNCRETYSYTYYEAFEAGCYVVTSLHSGNITDQVLINKNGKTFSNLNECIYFLNNLQGYTNITKIINVRPNSSLIEFEPNISDTGKKICKDGKKPNCILSLLYSHFRRAK